MTIEAKLSVHLLSVVSPLGVPLTGPQQMRLLGHASEAQRMAAVARARVKVPFLLPDEEPAAMRWATGK